MTVSIPHIFAGRQGGIPAQELDDDFAVLAAAINLSPTVVDVSPSASPAANRTAIQAAHDALPAAGGILWFTQYGIHIDAQINITKPVLILGPGTTEVETPGSYALYLDTVGQNGFDVTGRGPFIMQHFSMLGAAGATNVLLNGPAGALNGTESCLFDDVVFAGGAFHIDQRAALFTRIRACLFNFPTTAGYSIQNTLNGDQGDSIVYGDCIFRGSATAKGVLWRSGGGLKILGNKFLGHQAAISIQPEAVTQDFIIADNSIESFDVIGIEINRTVGVATILYVDIHDNQISRLAGGGGAPPHYGIALSTVDAVYVTDVLIHDNFISDVAVGVLCNGGTRVAIHDNSLLRVNTGDAQGIKLEGAVATVDIGRNIYTAVTSPIAGGVVAQMRVVDTGLGYTVATLPAGVRVGSMVFATDALGPGDGGYTGYGMVATGGGSGAVAIRQNGQWRC